MQLTVHCLIKNEENFIFYAIKSVVDFVDKIIIFDTGSTDKTVAIVNSLVNHPRRKLHRFCWHRK
jgi:glycosyltransferase involved in cell wall biosynthesis